MFCLQTQVTTQPSTIHPSDLTSSQSPSITPSSDPAGLPSYVLPAATSVVVVLLVVILIAIFVVVICIITRRHNTQKSLEMQHLSIHYQSTQRRKSSDVTFNSHLFAVGQSAEVPIHDTNDAVDKSNDGEIRNGLCNYSSLGPSESNNNVVQGAVEEPVAEGDISRPASQASIHSNEVPSKLTYGEVTWVHPSMLDHPYDSCNKEIAMAASGGGGHYETSPHWQPAEETSSLPPDCRAVGKHTAGEVGKFPPVSGGAAGVLGLLQECHSNPPKPSCSAQSVSVPQEDHIYSAVDKSHKKSASSSRFPQTGLTHSTDATDVCSEIDGSRKVDREALKWMPWMVTSATSPDRRLLWVTFMHRLTTLREKVKERQEKVKSVHYFNICIPTTVLKVTIDVFSTCDVQIVCC